MIRKTERLAVAVGLALGLTLMAGTASALPTSIWDFAVYGSGGITTGTSAFEASLGTNVIVNGNVGSNQDVYIGGSSIVNGNVFAGGSLRAGSDSQIGSASSPVTVISNLDSDINGQIYGQSHSGSAMPGFGTGADSLLLRSNSDVHGDVFTKRDLHFNANSGITISGPPGAGHATVGGAVTNVGTNTIGGGATTGSTAGLLSWDGVILAGAISPFGPNAGANRSCAGAGCTSLDLTPDSYGTLDVGTNKTVTLHSGTYRFDKITTNSGLDLYLDLSSGGPINILVNGIADFGTNQDVFIKRPGATSFVQISLGSAADIAAASLVYLETLDKFSINSDSEWAGTVFASKLEIGADEITVGNNVDVWGALYAYDSVSIAQDSEINFVRSYLDPSTAAAATAAEPGAMAILAAGLASLGVIRRRRRMVGFLRGACFARQRARFAACSGR